MMSQSADLFCTKIFRIATKYIQEYNPPNATPLGKILHELIDEVERYEQKKKDEEKSLRKRR